MPGSSEEWSSEAHVVRYLARARGGWPAVGGDAALLEQLPSSTRRVLDLGTGDGRLLALTLAGEPERRGLGLDSSELMVGRRPTR
jgi:methylase of polypeptide subunit release factors